MAITVGEVHKPVLVPEILDLLDVKPARVYLDGTLGKAGHALPVLERSSPDGKLIGVDRDAAILEVAEKRLEKFRERIRIVHGDFSELKKILENLHIQKVDGITLDLGVSSLQLDEAQRGFSFGKEGPLDMRMNPQEGETVLEKISKTDEKELADVLYRYGEERLSFKIARGILAKFEEGKLKTTLDLAEIAWKAYPPRIRHKRPHPATRTFQALRIWVNKEMQNLESFLKDAPTLLALGGRMAVISYHSLEDRLVKHAFRKWAQKDAFEILTKKPIVPGDEEVEKNPRARSAKLRGLLRCS